jgi:hypothetical protein
MVNGKTARGVGVSGSRGKEGSTDKRTKAHGDNKKRMTEGRSGSTVLLIVAGDAQQVRWCCLQNAVSSGETQHAS